MQELVKMVNEMSLKEYIELKNKRDDMINKYAILLILIMVIAALVVALVANDAGLFQPKICMSETLFNSLM